MICVEGLSTARQSKDDNDEKDIRKKSTEIPLTADADTPKVVVKAFCTDVLRARIHISTNGMKSGVRILLSHFGGNILEVSLAVLHSSSIKYTAKKLWIIHSVVGCVNEYIERYGRDTAAERYVTPYCRCESQKSDRRNWIGVFNTMETLACSRSHYTSTPHARCGNFQMLRITFKLCFCFFLSLPSSPSSPSLLSSSADGNDPVCCWLVFASASRTCTNFHLDIYCKWSRVGARTTFQFFFFVVFAS